jgi:hypothetical protein
MVVGLSRFVAAQLLPTTLLKERGTSSTYVVKILP